MQRPGFNTQRPGPRNINYKQFYQRYKLLVWLSIGYAVILTAFQTNLLTILYYTYLIFFSGKLFMDYIGRKDFINIWTGATAISAIVYAIFASQLSHFPFPAFATAALAGGALGLIAGAATFMPNAPMKLFFLGPFPFKYLAVGLIFLDVFSAGEDAQRLAEGTEAVAIAVEHFTHLLGAAAGFSYIYFRRKGIKTDKLFSWFYQSSKPKMKTKKGGKQYKKPPKDDIDYNAQKIEEQKKIDEILDKISKSGYESLTKKEKEMLFSQSKD
ncbi:MAG: rhomboid family intramembrane serine protease [Bacteroidales bacterium]